VAELADAQVSEACDGDIVEVQVLSSAPTKPSTDYIDSASTESAQSADGFLMRKNLSRIFGGWCSPIKRSSSERGVLMNVEQAALMETDNLRQSSLSQLPERHVRLKLAERPDRDRIQRVVDLADALLSEAETLARDKAFTEEATRLKPLDILGGINFYDEVQRFETHLIKMALSETGGNQAKAARLLGIKATTLNSKIKLYKIEIG
jgi:DNA-binding protein Fis